MKTVDQHLADVLSVINPLSAIDLQLPETHACILAEDVYAPAPLPAFDNSAMDGYAVRAADLVDASEQQPVALTVLGDVMAGSWQAQAVSAGSCLRIMTGAAMPAGADAVVPVEWTDGGLATVAVSQSAQEGQYVRRVGEDVPAGNSWRAAGLGCTLPSSPCWQPSAATMRWCTPSPGWSSHRPATRWWSPASRPDPVRSTTPTATR